MKTALAAACGLALGSALLAAAHAWARGQCLPLSADEFKWQCALTAWIIASAYLGASLVASSLAGRLRIPVAVIVLLVLFIAHTYLPQFGLVSFGKRWYLSADPLVLAAVPALSGVLLGMLFTGRRGRP